MVEIIKRNLLMLYGGYTKIYGPYLRKDGRMHIVFHNSTNSAKKTISWPRGIYEATTMEILKEDETIDHIDGDFTNNSPENIQILGRVDNIMKAWRQGKLTPPPPRYGKNNAMSVLSVEDVTQIRDRYRGRVSQYDRSCSQRSLAKEFSVSRSTIISILSRKTWKNVA